MNKNRATGIWSPVVHQETRAKERLAQLGVAGGMNKKEIAAALGVSPKRVDEYLTQSKTP